jgi:hypothetical protein
MKLRRRSSLRRNLQGVRNRTAHEASTLRITLISVGLSGLISLIGVAVSLYFTLSVQKTIDLNAKAERLIQLMFKAQTQLSKRVGVMWLGNAMYPQVSERMRALNETPFAIETANEIMSLLISFPRANKEITAFNDQISRIESHVMECAGAFEPTGHAETMHRCSDRYLEMNKELTPLLGNVVEKIMVLHK